MKESRGIKSYNSLYDFAKSLGIQLDKNTEFSIQRLEVIHPQAYKSNVFRANYYSFVFVKSGRGNYTTDNKTFDTKDGTIYFTNPGHIKAFELYTVCEGFIISFSEKFLKLNINKNVYNDFPFLLSETVPPGYLTKKVFNEFEILCEQLIEEFGKESIYKDKILASVLMIILLKIKERFWKDYNPLKENNRGTKLVREFKKSLEIYFRELLEGNRNKLPRVTDFAALAGLHQNYFSNVIRSKAGKSVNDFIVYKTITEAQALLSQSEYSIKEVSYQLGFSEPTHFTKFFKKKTGLTPKQYLKEIN